MNDYIPLSLLNDFIFCPYSIYLHSVYMGTDEENYQAAPQVRGTIAHKSVNDKTGSTRKADIYSLPVYSDSLGISGMIDQYKGDRRQLIERKNNLKNIFRGQLYQLWGQYFCMIEMGYPVEQIAFYEISTNKMMPLALPTPADRAELEAHIARFKAYEPLITPFKVNPNKCSHCIYCNLCDKTDQDHVYT